MKQTLVILVFIVLIAMLAYDIAIVLTDNPYDDLALQENGQDSSDSPTSICEHDTSNPIYCKTISLSVDQLMLWLYALY